MEISKIHICCLSTDAAFMKQLAVNLENANPHFVIDQLYFSKDIITNEISHSLKNASLILLILSPDINGYSNIIKAVSNASQHNKIVIPVTYKPTEVPALFKNILAFNLSADYASGLINLSRHIDTILRIDPDPPRETSGNIFTSIIKKINLFKKKSRFDDVTMKAMPGNYSTRDGYSGSGASRAASYESSSSGSSKQSASTMGKGKSIKEKIEALLTDEDSSPAESNEDPSLEMAAPIEENPESWHAAGKIINIDNIDIAYMSGGEPLPPPSSAAPSPVQSSKGKILYDIPASMMIKQQHKCVIRIGETEAIVRDDDTFSGNEVVEDVPVAKVMNVELIDVNEPQRFIIKTISSAEQELEEDSYTQWLFWVTPLAEGNYSLLVKVSVIKIIDGKERRKELVFEKPVNIVSSVIAEAPVNNIEKNLLDEKNIAEINPPNVFISYAHSDKEYFDAFLKDIGPQSGWKIWTDKNIEIGSGWFQRIQDSINNTDMAVLLVSGNFINSGFIKENEFAKFDELSKNKAGFLFLPVLLRDTDINRWGSLSQLQFFSVNGDDYDVPDFKGKLMPFAALCIFNAKGELNPNYHRDTYFKNFVMKANTDWMKANKARLGLATLN